MPRTRFRRGSSTTGSCFPEALAAAAADPLALEETLGALNGFSLVRRTTGGFSLHRLVQLVTRERLGLEERQRHAGHAVRLLAHGFVPEFDGEWDWADAPELLAHALAAAEHAERLKVEPAATEALLAKAGSYLRMIGDNQGARSALERALAIAEDVYGPEHPNVAIRLSYLAIILGNLGEAESARPLLERAHESSALTIG